MKHSLFVTVLRAMLPATLAIAILPVQADVLSLDGNGDYVTFPGTGIPSGNASFTIEVWINPISIPTGGQDGGQMTFWGNQSANQANGFRLRGSAGLRHYFWANDHDENLPGDILPDNTGPSANGWHHFAITFDGNQTRWYWNGTPLGNPRTAAGVAVVAANHRIGARLGAEFFHGYLDELRIWNVARSAAAIAADFQRELNGDEPGLVAYWNFEGNMVDRAGGDNNGTPVDNATVLTGLNAPVLPVGPRIYAFTANPGQIYLAQTVTLSWAVSNATSVVIDNGIGAVAPTNSLLLSPTVTTTFTLTATNVNGTRTAMTTVTVDPGIPMAANFSTNTAYNTPVAITLRGSDPQGSNLTFAIVMPPAHGNLSGTPPNVTYQPALNFGGLDAFTFKVNDGMFDSAPATVSLNVVPPPLPPTGIVLTTTNIPVGTGPGAFLAVLQAIDINNIYGDSHTFGLVPGFGDNAKFVVSGSSLLTGPPFTGGPGAVFQIRLRATDSTSLSYTQDFTLAVVAVARTVVINEIHYNPSFNPVRESFVELYNDTDAPIDLSQWRVRGGVDYYFPSGTTLGPRSFALVAEDPATLQSRYGRAAYGPWNGGLNNEGEQLTLRDANGVVIDEVDYRSEFPWPVGADGNGPSAQLVHPGLDNNLGSSWRSAAPTPGATNAVFATNAAPQIRQVDYSPGSPRSTNQVAVTCKVTDPNGVASVQLAYQVVPAGSFIPAQLPLTIAQLNNLNIAPMTNALNPAFELAANWTTVAMHDDGVNGDATAGDGVYSVLLPQQAHRTLVRYRITCTDLLGAARRAPFEDDPSLNFAYFVYDDLPAYLGFSAASLQTLQVYTLITRDQDLTNCTAWYNPADQLTAQTGPDGRINQGRLAFNWEGAFVHDGKVFDHVHYRLRGANGRYHNGKRSFRIKFNDGALFQAEDNNGKKFPTKWREIVTGKGQSNRGGEQFALNEVVNYFLWNKVGVPAPRTLNFHFRVIRSAAETNQYAGDFWGLNWAQEKYDANFLTAHDLPKGNLYKLVDNFVAGAEELRYQGALAPTNAADFNNIENNLTGLQSADWLNAHANYTNWYRYFTIARAIRHYDTWPSANKNGAWYFEPLYGASNSFLGRMMQLPYDSTDTWGATWNNGDDVLYNGIFPSTATGGDSGQNPEMQKEYRNVVREIRALLFQPDQIHAIIDAHAAPIAAVAAADYARWLNAPSPASYSALAIPSSPGVTGGLPAYQQDMKNFMFVGGNNAWWIDRQSVGAGGWVTVLDAEAADAAIPNQPSITYVGTNGFPVDGLVFQSSPFSDPQGAGTFGAMQWRVAEVLPTNASVTSVSQLRLEWDATWLSAALPAFDAFTAVPAGLLEPERLYRARVRHQDNTGRWSRWSAPVEFRPRAADIFGALRRDLVFNELNYNPPAEGATDGDQFEFIELKNKGTNTLELTGLYFSDGVDFSFTNGTRLAPGAIFLLAPNPVALAARYPGVTVHGVYTGKLNNDGEHLAISHPVAGVLVELEYGDRAPWPVAADGFGFTLAYDPATGTYRTGAAAGGTPGIDSAVSGLGGVVINEILSSSTLPLRDSIELMNITETNINIGGWYLTDDPQFPFKYRITDGTILASGDQLVFDETQFNPTPGLGVSFSLSSLGDDVYLFSAGAPGTLSGYSHGLQFGGAQDGVSFGRYVNSVGDEHFPLQLTRTPDAPNSGPRVGPVVISEIHYHPPAAIDEFVEVKNIAATNVSLYDPAAPTNTWRLNGLGFAFPTGVTLPPNGLALLVNGEPTAFRARWSVPAAVPIFQYTGADLQNSGESLELQAPDLPTTNGTPYFAVDAVRYNDRHPWPLAADGAGASLQRSNTSLYGNDPIRWFAASPTPGSGPSAGTAPVITSQPAPAARTNAVGGIASFTASATGSPSLSYQWRFGGEVIEGATNATLLLSNLQLEHAGAYSLVVFNGAGSAESSNAVLVVRVGATLTAQPTNVFVFVSPDSNASPTNRATFAVGAVTFNPPLRYQWQFNGAPISGATNATYSFTNVQFADGGAYRCAVSDEIAETFSAAATLTPVIRPRVIDAPSPNLTNVVNSIVTIGVTVTGYPPPFVFRWLSNSLVVRSNLVSGPTDFVAFTAPPIVPAGLHRYRVEVTNLFGVTVVEGVNRIFFTNYFLPDADLDRLPDSYEADYGMGGVLNPLDDADNDGMNNLSEYIAGTDPTNALSFLRVNLLSAGGGASLQFGAVANRSYSIQYAPIVRGATWTKLVDIVPRPNDRVESIYDPEWTTNRFYRVVTPRQL